MSQFKPPNFYSDAAAQQGQQGQQGGGGNGAQQTPSSPPRLGYVAGAESKGEMFGYVGGKPAKREEPVNPQSRRQMTNLASPDPTLSQSAFTQSQFTSGLNTASTESAAVRAAQLDPAELRRENLRKYKAGSSGSANRGSACAMPRPTMLQRNTTGGAQQRGNNNSQGQGSSMGQGAPSGRVESPSSAGGGNGGALQSPSYIAYNISDPGLMFKAFSGSGWVQVVQLIVPDNRRGSKVKIYISAMMTKDEDEETTSDTTYSLRIIDPTIESITTPKTLWAEYSASNSDSFQVFSLELVPTSTMIEVQVQNSNGRTAPILVSSVLLEW
jgi:hypothetical protein